MTHYQAARRAKLRAAGAAAVVPVDPSKELVNAHVPRSWRKYGDEDVERALLAVVMEGGIVKRGAELVGIPQGTVQDWTLKYAARYAELRRAKGPELERRAVDGLMAFVTAAEDVKQLALAKTREELERGDTKDPGATLRNISTAQGISVTKIMELTGRPTANSSGRSASELLAALTRLNAISSSTPGTAVELPALPEQVHSDDQPVAADADSTAEA